MITVMSSILEKTIDQAFTVICNSSDLRADAVLKTLENMVMGMRSMNMLGYRNVVDQCHIMLQRKSIDVNLPLSERRHCLLVIIHLGNRDEKFKSIHPFVIKCIEDAASLFDKLLAHIALRVISKLTTSDAYLAVNALQKDIGSGNANIVSVALTTLAMVIDHDLVPVFLEPVQKIIREAGNYSIRCKALTVLQVMNAVGSEFVQNKWELLLQTVCDKDPHVMSSSLPVFETLLKVDVPPKSANIPKKFIYILQQVQQGRIPLDMMYSGICAPWVFMNILRLLQKLPTDQFVKSDYTALTMILRQTFARCQCTSYVEVALILECCQIVVYLYSKLGPLDDVIINVASKILASSNVNLQHSGVELLRSLRSVKPEIICLYKDSLLAALNSASPNTFKIILEFLGDFISAESENALMTALIAKLHGETCLNFRKCILFGILKLMGSGFGDDIVENYLFFLSLVKNDLDFTLINKIVKCVLTASEAAVCKEVCEITKRLEKKYTTLQYCTMIQILSFHYHVITKDDCEEAILGILDNCRRLDWNSQNEDVAAISWKTISEVSEYLEVSLNLHEFSLTAPSYTVMLELQFTEHEYLSAVCNSAVIIKDTSSDEAIDRCMSFLKVPGVDNSLLCGPVVAAPTSVEAPPDVSVFKRQPYSVSRFDNSKTALPKSKIKKTFLTCKTSELVHAAPWDSQKYNLKVGKDNCAKSPLDSLP